jgi:sporulation protein YlmC with PRC-barrel domain
MNAIVQAKQKELIGKQARLELRQEKRKDSLDQTKEYREYKAFTQQMSRASTIIDTMVKNFQGQDLGKIKDLVFDPETGHLVYAVIAFGGLFAMDKLFAVPWKALRWTGNKTYYVLNIDKATLEKAPGFDKNHWPDCSNSWNLQRDTLNEFYGVNY